MEKNKDKLSEEMKQYICKINLSSKENGTGFFTKFTYSNRIFCVLVTSYQIINKEYKQKNNEIRLSFDNDKEYKNIHLSEDRIIYFSKEYDITMIEVKKSDEIKYFLELDDNLFCKKPIMYYENKSIYLLQYKDVVIVSQGVIKKMDEHRIEHSCPAKRGSSGAPLLDLETNQVIGINRTSSNDNNNRGIFLRYPIHDFLNQEVILSKNTKQVDDSNNYDETGAIFVTIENLSENIREETDKENEVIITVQIPRKDVNTKNIYFLEHSTDFKDGTRKDHLKELTKENTEIYINGVRYGFKKYFLAEKEGTYTIKIKFKTLLMDCSYMFTDCKYITAVDLSNLETKNLVNMKRMFYDCENITSINLSSLDTRMVSNMECLFGNCKNLENIDVSSFDTRNVANMKNMFNSCKKLQNIDLSNFNTEKCINMQCMFCGCNNLLSLDLSSFNTKNVTNMLGMFDGCYKLENVNLISFNTTNVTNMEKMFNCCCSLTSLDLSPFSFENVTNMKEFLYGCDQLKQVKANINNQEVVKKQVDPNNFYVKIIV